MLYLIEKAIDERVFAFELADTDKPHQRGNRPSKVVRGTIGKQVQLLVGNFELLIGHNQAFGTLSYDFLKFGIEALQLSVHTGYFFVLLLKKLVLATNFLILLLQCTVFFFYLFLGLLTAKRFEGDGHHIGQRFDKLHLLALPSPWAVVFAADNS